MSFPERETMRAIGDCMVKCDKERAAQIFAQHPEYLRYEDAFTTSWLCHAATYGGLELVKLLIQLGLDINKTDARQLTSPLQNAIANGHVELVEFLLQQGADPKIGRTLISAINHDDRTKALQMVKLLVKYDADPNRSFMWFDDPNLPSFTPLTWAEANGKTEIAAYLRSQGAVPPAETPRKQPASCEEEIVAQLTKQFGPVRPAALAEIVPTGLPIAIHVIPPTETHKQLTLFTTGMSEQPMTVPEGQDEYRYAELLIHLPADWPLTKKALGDPRYNWPIRWLQNTARYPYDNNTWLGGPFTIITTNPPQKIAPDAQFTAMMLAAKSEMCCANGRLIQFYTLVPLYPEERELEVKQDLPTLMRAFDRHGISDVVDLHRKNAAKAF
jgi:hypothetical protein